MVHIWREINRSNAIIVFHLYVSFYVLRMIKFSRLGALVSPNISYLCSVRGTFFLLKTDKYSESTSVIL